MTHGAWAGLFVILYFTLVKLLGKYSFKRYIEKQTIIDITKNLENKF